MLVSFAEREMVVECCRDLDVSNLDSSSPPQNSGWFMVVEDRWFDSIP